MDFRTASRLLTKERSKRKHRPKTAEGRQRILSRQLMSASERKADVAIALRNVRYWPKADIPSCAAHVRFRG